MTAEQLPLHLADAGSLGLPRQLDPMRARPAADAFDSDAYLFETRWNGVRTLAAVEAGRVVLRNRRLGDISQRFPELKALRHAAVEQPLLLDGEIVIVDEHGKPDFDGLQRRLRLVDEQLIQAEAVRHPACLLTSDVLFHGRHWLLSQPLARRKRLLAEAVHQADCLYLAEVFEDEGRALFQAAIDSDLEGVLAKPKAGPYSPGSFSGGWLSIGRGREEFVIGGYSLHIAGGSRTVELLLGSYDDEGQLTFVASVRPPADEKLRNELFAVLNALQMDAPPFAQPPPFIACWVRPELVVTVSYAQRDTGREMRYPVLERVRLDVAPDECLLPVDAPALSKLAPEPDRPHLTLLTTLPLPFDTRPGPTSRPALHVVERPR